MQPSNFGNQDLQQKDDDMEGIVNLQDYENQEEEDDMEGIVNLEEYSNTPEAEEASWWDVAKDVFIQPTLGVAQAFTWPLDLLKVGMIGEGLSDIDELESAFEKAGKPFDRDKYIKTVMEQGEFIPTQDLLEDVITKQTGISLEPKSKTGKFLNKLFFLGGLTRGKGVGKAIKAGVAGAGTTTALREAGAPEFVSEIAGDIVGGGVGAFGKTPRNLSPEAKRLQDIGKKHGLPFLENMAKDEIAEAPKITSGRKAALEKELGMTTEEAINRVIENEIPTAKLRAHGRDLEVLETEAYDKAKSLAQANPNAIKTDQIVSDIDAEIARIKGRAPSPSDAERAAISILENEKNLLSKAKPTTEQLVNQTQNYNSNVKSIYRKAEFSGVEEEVKNAYGFLNGSINRTIEQQAGQEVAEAYSVARKIYGQNAALARTEGQITKAFKDGNYNPKKLRQVLNSKQGAIIRRDIGEQGVKELHDIADFGERAQAATMQYAKSGKHKFNIGEWGPLAGFLLAKIPGSIPIMVAAKPFADYVRGWALTRPAARTVYQGIVKNAANGSFKNMAADFGKLESMIKDEYGSMEDFMKSGVDELRIYEGD